MSWDDVSSSSYKEDRDTLYTLGLNFYLLMHIVVTLALICKSLPIFPSPIKRLCCKATQSSFTSFFQFCARIHPIHSGGEKRQLIFVWHIGMKRILICTERLKHLLHVRTFPPLQLWRHFPFTHLCNPNIHVFTFPIIPLLAR